MDAEMEWMALRVTCAVALEDCETIVSTVQGAIFALEQGFQATAIQMLKGVVAGGVDGIGLLRNELEGS